MRILISAYACEPGAGSEPGAGWTWARAAARRHDVWLLTRKNNRAAIEAALREEPSLSMNPIYLDLPSWAMRWKKGQRGVHAYYLAWQVLAGRVGRRLQSEIGFDVAHHLTFAVDWMPAGVAHIPDLPMVWGPVGGTTGVPATLWHWLGLRGAFREVTREIVTRFMRRCFAERVARRAALVVAQNTDVAYRFRRLASSLVVEPNVALEEIATPLAGDRVQEGRRAVFAGRLLPLKGVRLALAALADEAASRWKLDVYGDGPERTALEGMTRRLGLSSRVTFHGPQPRQQVLQALANADAFLFPSMHEGAPWAVGEALAVGCPVVCLDRGGAPLLIGERGGIAVTVSRGVVHDLASALEEVGQRGAGIPLIWSEERLPEVLTSWYKRATGVDHAAVADAGGVLA